jgi:hypothetical protein
MFITACETSFLFDFLGDSNSRPLTPSSALVDPVWLTYFVQQQQESAADIPV